MYPERNPTLLRERQMPSLKAMLLFGALNKITGHSKPIDRVPMSSYTIAETHHSRSPARKKSNYQPPPLTPSLSRRRGCITPPLQEDVSELSHVQAPLLAMPREVLLQIYYYVVGNNVIHIVRRSNRLGHIKCKDGSSGRPNECRAAECRSMKLSNGVCASMGEGDTLLPLLQTCRKIYVEAIDVLYESNTFDFDCMEALISFSTCVVPRRFDAIRKLQLDFRFDKSSDFNEATPVNDYARWERMWRIVGSMKNLQHLWVQIGWWRTDLTGTEEARYLGELLQVGTLKEFEISLPILKWNDPKDKEVGGTFDVVRRATNV